MIDLSLATFHDLVGEIDRRPIAFALYANRMGEEGCDRREGDTVDIYSSEIKNLASVAIMFCEGILIAMQKIEDEKLGLKADLLAAQTRFLKEGMSMLEREINFKLFYSDEKGADDNDGTERDETGD